MSAMEMLNNINDSDMDQKVAIEDKDHKSMIFSLIYATTIHALKEAESMGPEIFKEDPEMNRNFTELLLLNNICRGFYAGFETTLKFARHLKNTKEQFVYSYFIRVQTAWGQMMTISFILSDDVDENMRESFYGELEGIYNKGIRVE
jgi:hypothetical protein